jgi:hypothetical protein
LPGLGVGERRLGPDDARRAPDDVKDGTVHRVEAVAGSTSRSAVPKVTDAPWNGSVSPNRRATSFITAIGLSSVRTRTRAQNPLGPQLLKDESLQRRQVALVDADVREALVRPDGHRREHHPPVGELAALDAPMSSITSATLRPGSTPSMNANACRPV